MESAMNQGWQSFAKKEAEKTKRSNARIIRLLSAIKGTEFTMQLQAYRKLVKSETSAMRITRKPTGIAVTDKRFALIPNVWLEQRECEDGKYAYVCIQVKPNRWVRFVVWF
jgi:hypothetical protein